MQIQRRHFESIDSTNTWAKANLKQFDKDKLTLITANQQTGGRGRWKRSWHSPPDRNIYATYCFFLPTLLENIGNIPQVLALSCAQLLRDQKLVAEIKWPNDILVDKKKISGILCETVVEGAQVAVVIGIGLNVNMEQALLDHIDQPATSMLIASGRSFDIEETLQMLTERFNLDLECFLHEGFTQFLETYRKWAHVKFGTLLTLNIPPNKFQGYFQAFDETGSIILKDAAGKMVTFHAGEIVNQ